MPDTDQDNLTEALADNIDTLAQDLLGQPSYRQGTSLRWGSRGSLSVEIKGSKKGKFYDFEHGAGGGPIGFIAHVRGSTTEDAVAFAEAWLDGNGVPAQPTAPSPAQNKSGSKDNTADRKTEAARAIARRAVPAHHNRDVMAYLANRGLTQQPPASIKAAINPTDLEGDATAALVAVVTDESGTIQGIQRVFVRDGAKATIPGLPKAKRSLGNVGGGTVHLPGAANAPRVLAEGPETGLSVWQATGYPTDILLGGFKRAQAQDRETVLMARDGDAEGSAADKAVHEAARNLGDLGATIYIAWPGADQDFNDLLREHGDEAVRGAVEQAAYAAGPVAPTFPDKALPVEEARQRIHPAIQRFLDDLEAAMPTSQKAASAQPKRAVFVDMGLGKSRTARDLLEKFIRKHDHYAAFTRDDASRNRHHLLKRGVIAVPTHSLAREYVRDLQDRGISALHWVGRDYEDPDTEEPACHDRDAVELSITAIKTPESSACKTRTTDGTVVACPHLQTCMYQRQKEPAEHASVVVTTHAALFEERPRALAKRGWLVIDEDFTGHGTRGVDGKPVQLTLEGFREPAEVLDRHGNVRPEASRQLTRLRQQVAGHLAALDDGVADIKGLCRTVSVEVLREAAKLENHTMKPLTLYPGMSQRKRKEAWPIAQYNATIPRRARVFKILAESVQNDQDHAAGLEMVTETGNDGPIRKLRLRWRVDIKSDWPKAVLYLDGTGNLPLARHFLSQLQVDEPIRAQTPNQHVRQVSDRRFSAHMLDPAKAVDTDQQATAEMNLLRVRAYICARAREVDTGGHDLDPDVLVVTLKSVEGQLLDLGLRDNVDTAHFNDLRGRDRWRNVRLIIVVGRPLPAARQIEHLHWALTNQVPTARPNHEWWYDKAVGGIRLPDGRGWPVDVAYHPDPLCEALRWHICEAELLQAIGRGRGVNRDADTPLQIDVMADVVLPLTVSQVSRWERVKPGPFELMLPDGFAVSNSHDAVALHPHLFRSPQAVRKGFQRERSVTGAYKESPQRPLSQSSAIVEGRYQRRQQGAKPATVYADSNVHRLPDEALKQHVSNVTVRDFDIHPGRKLEQYRALSRSYPQGTPVSRFMRSIERQLSHLMAPIRKFKGLVSRLQQSTPDEDDRH